MSQNTQDEISAVKQFLKNRDGQFEEKDIEKLKTNDPVDIVYKKTNEKFQVKRIPSGEMAVFGNLDGKDSFKQGGYEGKNMNLGIGKIKTWVGPDNWIEVYLKEPIINLIKTYGSNPKDLSDITCILYVVLGLLPPFPTETYRNEIKKIKEIQETGFKDIYLVGREKNIKIHPLN